MKMKKVSIAILGCGHISGCHLHGYRACSEIAEISALCDTNRAAAERWAEEFELDVPIYTSFDEVCSADDVDAVDICVPITGHYEAVCACLEAKKHVIVEKPWTDDMSHAVHMHELTQRVGRQLMVAQCQRFQNRFLAAKEILEKGLIGKPYAVQAHMVQDVEKVLGFDHWHMKQGGALLSIGVHILDSLRSLFGDAQTVSAMGGRQYAPMARDDVTAINLRFKSGILANIYASYASKILPWGGVMLLVHGTKGGFSLLGNSLTLYSEADPTYATSTSYPIDPNPGDWRQDPGFIRECREFIESILEDREPSTSSRDNFQTMGIVCAGYESARTGKTIQVESFLKEHGVDAK